MMSATATSASMSYDEVNKLAFRALQSQCKQLGLSAVGTTAALRGRLLDHFGLSREIALKKEAPAASAAEIEVRKALAPFFSMFRTTYISRYHSSSLALLGTLRHRRYHFL
jgi:hypothetical protein